ncbi:MAG TPA: hypothetical protein VFD92_01875 [Candidatus Binatia bacterium]|nr:hypothetical protein [Candidatus Binatia bacterium]
MSGRPIAIYAGYLVRCPIGGYLWQVVHYLRGLRDAGVDVWFWEDTRHTWQAYDPIARSVGADYDAGIRIAGETLASVGFADRWIFHDSIHDRSAGAGRDAARWLFANARILINAAGVHRFSAEERAGKTCIYVDMDPAYTQLRVAGGDRLLAEMLAEHDLHFTFGENIGTDRSRIPTGGFDWRPTRQPIALDLWPTSPIPAGAPFTTIGTWDSPERDVAFEGERYSWSKREEWAAVMELPRATGERFRLAMEVRDPADRARLEAAGWEISDPISISRDRFAYQDFLRTSRAEFTTAKDVNVRLRSAWFSDRSACYLATGRPVVTQDTAFGDVLPTGEGLFAYRTADEAAAALTTINNDPQRHSAAARGIAEQHFAAERVVTALLEPI